MQSGVLFGAVDGINGMLDRMRATLGPATKTVLTGGFAELLQPHIRGIDAMSPLLVLEGALAIYRRHHERTAAHP
jgi:type III pantothenate kinase